MTVSCFIHFSINEYIDGFQLHVIVNDAAIYISIYVSVHVSRYASIYLEEELLGHRVCTSSTLLYISKLFSKVLAAIFTPF